MNIGKDLEQLENLLWFYGKIRQLDFKPSDFIDAESGHVLETNQQLLQDAAMYTKDIESPRDIEAHHRAQEALLLWCMIYCQRVLMASYHSKSRDQKEKIESGVRLGVMKCFHSLRKSINEYFCLPEEERKAKFKANGNCSVKTYMMTCAGNAVLSDFRTFFKDLIEIPPDDAERRKDNGEVVFETRGRFYIFKNVSDTVVNPDGESYENPEKLKVLIENFVDSCVQKMLDDHDLKVFLQQILFSMIQDGSLSKDDLELLSRSCGFRDDPEKIADIERDWIKRGKIKEGEIYNRRNRILTRLRKCITEHPKWKDFSESMKAGRPVWF